MKDNHIALQKRTASSFGYEWAKFSEVFAEYEANFLSYISPMGKEFFKGKLVLDAGCGAGRHTLFATKYGAKVVGIDLSEKAVQSARNNMAEFPNAQIMQRDIYTFEYPEKFECILCIGVLHHLPTPQVGFNKLVSLLKSGGTILIWVYGKKDNKLAMYLYEPLRKITTRMPHVVLYFLAFLPAVAMEMCNRLKLPLFSCYAQFPFKTKLNDAFDVFSAPFAVYYTIEEIQNWFETAGLKDIRVSYRVLGGVAKGIKGLGIKE